MLHHGNFRSLFRAAALLAGSIAGALHAAPARPCLSGIYDGGQMEMAAGLQLDPDGRFEYALGYGALDEEAKGRWESDGASVFLTSDPVRPPRFALTGEGAGAKDRFRVLLDVPQGMARQYFDIRLTLADGQVIERQFADDGLDVRLNARDRVVSAQLMLRVYSLESESFALSGGLGREAHFRFEPNDLGKVAFDHTPLSIEGRDLLIDRFDRQVRFRPTKGGCGK